MTKVRLTGSPQTQWNIGSSFIAGGTVVDFDKNQLKKHADIIEEILDKKIEKPKRELFTERQFYRMSKDQQTSLLKKYGIKKIPRLEKDRVRILLEVQK